MDIFVALGRLGLLLTLTLFLGKPLWAFRHHGQLLVAENQKRQLIERKEQLYTAIKEIEFDHDLGKLPDEDYARLCQPLEAEALSILQQLDRFNGQGRDLTDLTARLERDVLALRRLPKRDLSCASCNAERRSDDLFCPHCGARHEEGSNS